MLSPIHDNGMVRVYTEASEDPVTNSFRNKTFDSEEPVIVSTHFNAI